jgi:DNA ligase-1
MKEDILYRFQDIKGLLAIIYNPLVQFNITRDTLEPMWNTVPDDFSPHNSFEEFLKYLVDKGLSYSAELKTLCLDLIAKYEEHTEVIIRSLDKDLKCGISVKTLNKVFPKLIPEFNVPLADNYGKGTCDFIKDLWFMSRKLDGVRGFSISGKEESKIFSRKGKEFFTLDVIKEELEKIRLQLGNNMLDGEICIVDDEGNENFQAVMSQIRRKNFTMPKPKFLIFDMYDKDCFFQGKLDPVPYKERIKSCKFLLSVLDKSKVEVLDQFPILSENDFNNIPDGYEGFMLRKDGPTYFKRSKSLLKVKTFNDAEFKVCSIEKGIKSIDGVQKEVCSAIVIEYGDTTVSVGSGLSDKQRLDWYYHPEVILNKTVTVQYFEETTNKLGGKSLRFPTLKCVVEPC